MLIKSFPVVLWEDLIILKTLYNLIQTIQKATVQYIWIKLNYSHSNFKGTKFFFNCMGFEVHRGFEICTFEWMEFEI